MKWISHFLLLAALESYASLRNTVLKSTHCNRDTSHHVQSSISLMVTLPISSNHDITWMARRIKGTSTTSLNVKKSLDTDNSDENVEKVTYVNEVELRAFWSKSGMSAASYDEGAALMLLSDQDEDDDDDNDDDDDGIKEEVDVVPTTIDRQRLLRKKPSGSTPVIHQVAEKPIVTPIDKKKLLKKFMTKRKAESTDEKIAETTVTLDSSGVPIPAGRSVGE